jgi:hypothetical protein
MHCLHQGGVSCSQAQAKADLLDLACKHSKEQQQNCNIAGKAIQQLCTSLVAHAAAWHTQADVDPAVVQLLSEQLD